MARNRKYADAGVDVSGVEEVDYVSESSVKISDFRRWRVEAS